MNENVVVATPPTPLTSLVEAEMAPLRVVKLSWAGLFGGIIVAVGVWLLLTVLGLAVGLSSFDPNDTMHHIKSVGIGEGIWSLTVSIIALFIGGLVSARTSGILDRPAGAIHGAVLWALATILSIALVGGVVRNVVRGAANMAGVTLNVAGAQAQGDETGQTEGATAGPAAGLLSRAVSIDTTALVGPINDRLRAEGKLPIESSQVQASLTSAVGESIREGRIDKDILTTSIAENTGLSRGGARDIANQIDSQVNQKMGVTQRDLFRSGALSAAESVGKAMWWVFLGMLLGLIAAVLGSTLGVTRKQRIAAGVPVAERPLLATTREVLP